MGYDEEKDDRRSRRSRARQPVKRMGDHDANRRRNEKPGYQTSGLNLITDSFSGQDKSGKASYGSGRRENHFSEQRELDASWGNRESRSAHRRELDASLGSRAARRESAAADAADSHGSRPYSGGPETEGRRRRGASESRRKKREKEPVKTEKSSIYMDPAKRKDRKRKRKIRMILLEVVLLLGILAFGGYSYVTSRLDLMQRLPWDPDDIKNIEISEEKQEQMRGYWTVAIFGVDSRNSSVGKGNNSDVNLLCNINQDTGEIRLVSVFRDTYLNISDKNQYNKLNAAYLQGGPEQAVKALNKNLDLDIDDYATFNWKAVADAINILGGIDMEITKAEFYYINAFISETVKATGVPSTQLKSAGMNHLDGVQAVAYGRLRLMDTDYARTERQRKVIELAFEKAKKADWATLNNVVQTVFPQVATSVDISDILTMGRNITKYHITETMGFPNARGEVTFSRKGACVIPQTLEKNVTELHRFLFGDENYTPTPAVRAISQKIASDSGLAKDAKPIDSVGTNGGSIPKTTVSPEDSLEESTESGESESAPEQSWENETADETGESSHYPGETDAQGNMVFPSGGHGTQPESTAHPGTSGRPGTTDPVNGSEPGTESGTSGDPEGQQRPEGTTGETKETEIPRPGTGVSGGSGQGTGSQGGRPSESTGAASGNTGSTGQSGSPDGNRNPGVNTDTGIIIDPRNGF